MKPDLHSEALAAQALLAALREHVDNWDDEDAELADTAVEGETSLKEAVRAALAQVETDEGMAGALETTIGKLRARQDRLLARAKRVRGGILAALECAGLRKLMLPEATLSVGKGRGRVIVTDETVLPPAFIREVRHTKPDLTALGEALRAGEVVEGALLSNAEPTLSVRRV